MCEGEGGLFQILTQSFWVFSLRGETENVSEEDSETMEMADADEDDDERERSPEPTIDVNSWQCQIPTQLRMRRSENPSKSKF